MHMVNSRGRIFTEYQNYSKLENTIDTANNTVLGFHRGGLGGGSGFVLCDIYITCVVNSFWPKEDFFFLNCQLSLQTMNSGRKKLSLLGEGIFQKVAPSKYKSKTHFTTRGTRTTYSVKDVGFLAVPQQ